MAYGFSTFISDALYQLYFSHVYLKNTNVYRTIVATLLGSFVFDKSLSAFQRLWCELR